MLITAFGFGLGCVILLSIGLSAAMSEERKRVAHDSQTADSIHIKVDSTEIDINPEVTAFALYGILLVCLLTGCTGVICMKAADRIERPHLS
jgi:ABC-type antimicrobial peptide transport system permease subunit